MYINKTAMIELDDVIIWSASTYRLQGINSIAPILDHNYNNRAAIINLLL